MGFWVRLVFSMQTAKMMSSKQTSFPHDFHMSTKSQQQSVTYRPHHISSDNKFCQPNGFLTIDGLHVTYFWCGLGSRSQKDMSN